MYRLHDPSKFESITHLETDGFNRLNNKGYLLISRFYCPLDVDYQNAASSYVRHVGINVADANRDKMIEESIANDCHAFAMRHLEKKDADMVAYGSDYMKTMAELTGESPLKVLNDHLDNIEEHYGRKPDSAAEFRESVRSYYKDVLNYGKPAAVIQAMMDHQKAQADEAELDRTQAEDFAKAVDGLFEEGRQL